MKQAVYIIQIEPNKFRYSDNNTLTMSLESGKGPRLWERLLLLINRNAYAEIMAAEVERFSGMHVERMKK